jgi:hypothetical protein
MQGHRRDTPGTGEAPVIVFDILSPDGSPVWCTSLPNVRGSGPVHDEWVRNNGEIDRLLAKHDHAGRALYYAAAKLAAQMERATAWLMRCTKTQAISRAATSYGLKHLAEDWHAARGAPHGGYISNGVLLMAASRLGFQIEPIPGTPNAWLNLSLPAAAAHDVSEELVEIQAAAISA